MTTLRRLAARARRAVAGRVERGRRAVIGLGTRALDRAAPSFGRDVVARNIYSPVPEVPPPAWEGWHRRHPLPGIEVDPDAQLRYLESELAPYLGEFRPPMTTSKAREYHLDNGFYGAGDAEVLYATIRRHTPRRILELGGGFSTLVSAEACAANIRDGHPVEMTSVDPEPRITLPDRLASTVRPERADVRDLALERFLALEADDVLFVDTTHTVKLGSEVNRVVLEVLPRLRPGVLVHFHDIFLPYDYPRAWLARGTYVNEQYLVHALLVENPHWEIRIGLHALARECPERIRAAIPSFTGALPLPSALWLRRRPSDE